MLKRQSIPRPLAKSIIVGILLLLVSVLHYFTPYHEPLFHAVYRFLYYIPIILASIFWGKRGGILLSILINLVYLPHILLGWGKIELHSTIALLEILMYYFIGLITGHLIDMGRKEVQKKELLLEQYRQTEMQTALSQISYIIMHEMKTPLASISGAISILFENMSLPLDKQKFADIITSETRRMHTLLEKSLSSFSSGNLNQERINLKEFLEETRDVLSVIPSAHAAELSIRIAPGITTVFFDKELIKEALINLVNNAREALTQPGKIEIEVVIKDDVLQIFVRDNGPGMSEQAGRELFRPFFTTKNRGRGLGLSIVKRIIQLHRGNVQWNPLYQPGTEFILTFPGEVLIYD